MKFRIRFVPVGLMILILFGIFFVSCDEAGRHETLTFFFDGVPPLRPEMIPEGPDDSNALEPAPGDQKPAWYVHEPRKDCSICHGKRKQRSFSSQTYLTMPVPKLCYDCHTDYTLSASYVHGPVAVGQCLFCHNPHKSKIEYLLISPEPGLCYQCHDIDTIELIAGHSNKQLSTCTGCHYAHAGSAKALLKEVTSESNNGLGRTNVAEATSQNYIKAPKDQTYSDQKEKPSETLTESKNLSEVFRETSRLIEQGKLQEAGAYLEKYKDNVAFTAEQREQIAQILAMINKVIIRSGQQQKKIKKEQKIPENEQKAKEPTGNSAGSNTQSEQKIKEIAELYYGSMAFYRTGQLIKAREGFVNILKSGLIPESVAKTIRGYISDIDSSLAKNETSKKSKQ